jgi:hypothetical protein
MPVCRKGVVCVLQTAVQFSPSGLLTPGMQRNGEDSFIRVELELCLGPCLLISGPRTAGFPLRIYAAKFCHIYVTSILSLLEKCFLISNFFCFFFF